MELSVRQIKTYQQLLESVAVVRQSFATVALAFGFTKENAPTNAAFIEMRHLEKMRDKGILLLGVFCGDAQIGFVAVEKKADNKFYMERLAVLPSWRHKGFGQQIVAYVAKYVAEQGGQAVLIGIINEHDVLKTWYRNLGFEEFKTERFGHLPFTVCYMKKTLYST